MHFDYTRYKQFYTADFETSTEAWNVDTARVWLWDICTTELKHKIGTSLDSFMEFISRFDKCLFSFHNLSYDGSYILDWLLRNDFVFVNNKNLHRLEFTTIISPEGQHYCYEICFENGNVITINDSFKHNSMSVRKLAETYKLPILKGEIDYDLYREVGWTPTDEEKLYIKHDTEIVMRVLLDDIEHGFVKFTESGNSRLFFKKSYGTKEHYENLFPQLSKVQDEFIRHSYRGGYCYLKEEHFNKVLNGLMSVDINSMYPAQMLHRPLPYGEPIYVAGFAPTTEAYKEMFSKSNENEPPVYIQHLKCCFSLKPNKVPIIARKSFRGFNIKDLYLKDSGFKLCEMWLTSVDFELMQECYNVWDIEFIDAYVFNTKCGVEVDHKMAETMELDDIIRLDGKGSLYYDYLVDWRMQKEHEKGGKRERAKKNQNVAYGWQATSQDGTLVYPYINKHNVLSFKRYSGEPRKGGYLPIATFITAWSRDLLIRAILDNYDRFVYCDTDSMYLLGQDKPNLPIHNSLYGYFKIEHYIKQAKYLGCKRYIYITDKQDEEPNKLCVKCCGAPETVTKSMTFDNFVPYDKDTGAGVFQNKLAGKLVTGGKHLMFTTYKLIC